MGGYLGNQSVVTQINVSPTDVSDKDNASTGALDLPSGTTAQRPANPNTGYTRFNTTLGQQETWNGSAWVTSGGLLMQSVQTANFTAVAGNAYPVNTTAGAVTVTLPASPLAGNQVQIIDYAGTAATNTITIDPNGGKVNGSASNVAVLTNRAALALVYVDSTQGWVDSTIGNAGYLATVYSVSSLVIAGGGGGSNGGGGGGAGGLLSTASSLVAPGTAYTVTVGAGGSGGSTWGAVGGNGNNSVFGSRTAIAGGGGSHGGLGASGGSGGGGSGSTSGNGGNGTANTGGGGGGGNGVAQSYAGGGGGSGVVIISYAGAQRGTGGTVTSVGGNTIHTFTSSGTFTA